MHEMEFVHVQGQMLNMKPVILAALFPTQEAYSTHLWLCFCERNGTMESGKGNEGGFKNH